MRTRFAPSPTGYLHIGNGRTALFNWLITKKEGGTFILRIEDTDIARSDKTYVDQIMRDLKWLGVSWDEGPDVGGKFGPYIQSKRIALYRQYAKKLFDEGKAYYCYCSPEELASRRKKALAEGRPQKYDNRCRDLSDDQIKGFTSRGIKPAMRFRIDRDEVKVKDLIRGEVTFDLKLIGDFVIMKAGGYPAFNFAVVLDDCLMEITHVIRGEDHLSNTPRHVLLFDALKFAIPKFAHMALTRGPDGERLSKRTGAASIAHYREMGYMPEALANYMGLLGWSPKDNRELFTIDELIKDFGIGGMAKSSAIFDIDKLNWVSSHHIKSADLNRLADLAKPFLKTKTKGEDLVNMIDAVRGHLHNLSELPRELEVFLSKNIEVKEPQAREMIEREDSKEVLRRFLREAGAIKEFNGKTFQDAAKKIGKEIGVKGRDLYEPFRVALTGTMSGIELALMIPVLGKKECTRRIEQMLKKVGG